MICHVSQGFSIQLSLMDNLRGRLAELVCRQISNGSHFVNFPAIWQFIGSEVVYWTVIISALFFLIFWVTGSVVWTILQMMTRRKVLLLIQSLGWSSLNDPGDYCLNTDIAKQIKFQLMHLNTITYLWTLSPTSKPPGFATKHKKQIRLETK